MKKDKDLLKSEIMFALGNRERFIIFEKLCSEIECSSKDLKSLTGLSDTCFAHHSKLLLDAQIVSKRRVKHEVFFRIESNLLKRMAEYFFQLYQSTLESSPYKKRSIHERSYHAT